MQTEALVADATAICSGGLGMVFGKTTNSTTTTGSATARCYMDGVWYGNPEFIQIHPTAIPGTDKRRLISESVRGEGGAPMLWPATAQGREILRRALVLPEEKYLPAAPGAARHRQPPVADVCVNKGMASAAGRWSTST
jgi:succinate dehydrogenase/fumarate reductase flavoprotein subunit